MTASAEHVVLRRELKRFLVVAQLYHKETGSIPYMPSCPVDTEWHSLLNSPNDYENFCQETLGHEVAHNAAKGKGQIGWSGTYERLFGPLPEVWFTETNGSFLSEQREEYLKTGIFYASWDCTPY